MVLLGSNRTVAASPRREVCSSNLVQTREEDYSPVRYPRQAFGFEGALKEDRASAVWWFKLALVILIENVAIYLALRELTK